MSANRQTNDYLDHYRANNISPVRQDISNYDLHVKRRLGLYRTLGILPSTINGKKILEVGPGSGYNSLVVTDFKPEKYVLVEPNDTGVKHITELFEAHRVDMSTIDLQNVLVENFVSDEKFDVVFCEGMIPGLQNKQEVLLKLMGHVQPGGILAVTCADEISMFYEIIRIFLAHKLTSHLNDFQDKIKVTVEAFSSHLQTVRGFSRLIEDWCADCLFGEAHFNYDFSLKSCIETFRDAAFYYKSSPTIFTDFRWYKAVPTDPNDYNRHFIDQFDKTKHNLMLYTEELPERSAARNNELHVLCKAAMSTIHRIIYKDDATAEEALLTICVSVKKNLSDTTPAFTAPINDIIAILEKGRICADSVKSGYPHFQSAFGRGQQYISLIKNQ